MKKKLSIAAAVLAIAAAWFVSKDTLLSSDASDSTAGRSRGVDQSHASSSTGETVIRTKASQRNLTDKLASHRPEQLRDFILPEIDIRGLTLQQALRKLLEGYEDTCAKTGEKPLALAFHVPAGIEGKLNVNLTGKSFKNAVQLLATLAGVKSTRNGLEYRLEPFPSEKRQIAKTIETPPNLTERLKELAERPEERQNPSDPFSEDNETFGAPSPSMDQLLADLGLELDPGTKVTISNGKLEVTTDNAADSAAISALAKTLAEDIVPQQQFRTMVIDCEGDTPWLPDGNRQYDDAQIQLMMRELAQKKGAQLKVLPSIMAKSGYPATVELGPNPSGPAFSELDPTVTHLLHVRGNALGFGHDVEFDYSETSPSQEPDAVNLRISVKDSGFANDKGSRLVIQDRGDGTKSVVFVTSTLIDNTGRPLR